MTFDECRREIDTIRVVGRSGNVRIYEPIGRADEVTSDQSALIDAYARGLANWRARDFDQAYRCFEFLAAHDPPSRFFSQRCQKLMQNLPPSNWETVHILDSK